MDAQVTKDRQDGLIQADMLAGAFCQPESDASCTPDPDARLRRGEAAAGGEVDEAAGGEERYR
jgi:hypothetical protein